MGQYYELTLSIGKQEDGLWRVEAPALSGCWVDSETLEEALTEIQEVIAMTLDLYKREGWDIPFAVSAKEGVPTTARIPVVLDEYAHTKLLKPSRKKTVQKA